MRVDLDLIRPRFSSRERSRDFPCPRREQREHFCLPRTAPLSLLSARTTRADTNKRLREADTSREHSWDDTLQRLDIHTANEHACEHTFVFFVLPDLSTFRSSICGNALALCTHSWLCREIFVGALSADVTSTEAVRVYAWSHFAMAIDVRAAHAVLLSSNRTTSARRWITKLP